MDRWAYEKQAWAEGHGNVVGVDEAGLGPLAGPVVAAAVLLPRDFDVESVGDSKAMTPAQREVAFTRIMAEAAGVGVGIIDREIIDQINILQAAHAAMKAALKQLGVAFDCVLVDGRPVRDLHPRCTAIVRGDALSVSIGAASIVAKVTRDRIMCDLDRVYPEYGFAAHKGYGTRAHIAALAQFGPCPCHRRSFSPVAERLLECRLPGLG